MYSTIIIDNDKKSLKVLSAFFEFHDKINLEGCFDSVSKALRFLAYHAPHLLIIDEDVFESYEGNVWKELQRCCPEARIILTSYYTDGTLKILHHEVMDYLLKPACPEDVEQIVQKLEDQLSRQSLGYNKY